MPKENKNYRAATAEDEAIFNEYVREEFLRRICSEGIITQIRAMSQVGQHCELFVVANGISYTIEYDIVDGSVKDFTVAKTKKKSDCNIM